MKHGKERQAIIVLRNFFKTAEALKVPLSRIADEKKLLKICDWALK